MLESMTSLSHENKTKLDNNTKDNSSASSSIALSIPYGASTEGNLAYAPATLTVKKGDVITVTDDDTDPHTATSDAYNFDTSLLMPRKSAQIKADNLTPGDYPFHCTVHPYMKGTITVNR
jgi:cytochrome c oxidase subunit II